MLYPAPLISKVALLIFLGSLASPALVPPSWADPALAAHKQKFTGEVGDAMCGRKHMEGSAAECTRACVGHGSKYALVIGDKIYALNTGDHAALTTLNQEAGKRVTVTGALNGDEIEVSSVVPAK